MENHEASAGFVEGSVAQASLVHFESFVRAALELEAIELTVTHLVNCPEFLFVWFAVAKLGAVMVPTSPQATPDELAYLLDQPSQPREGP